MTKDEALERKAENARELGLDYEPERTWVGLTDGERNGLWRVIIGWGDPSHDDVDLMKAIEAALRSKNV